MAKTEPDITLGPFDPLATASPEAYRAMIEASTSKTWLRDEVVCRRGDPATYVCIVQEGRFAVQYRHRSGRMVQPWIMRRRALWGEVSLLRTRGRETPRQSRQAQRSADITVLGGPGVGRLLLFDQMHALRLKFPEIDRILVIELCQRVTRLTSQLSDVMTARSAHDRLRAAILELYDDAGGDGGADWLDVTTEELALQVGLGRQRVNDLLREDVVAGVIERTAGRAGLRVADADRLAGLIRD